MKTIAIIIYLLFCAGYISGFDDGKPWKIRDYLCVIASSIIAPVMVGMTLAGIAREQLSKRQDTEINPETKNEER